jgi:ketosteroid isomerase-like protein
MNKLLLTLLLVLVPLAQANERLSDESVRELYAQMQFAVEAMDVQAVMELMSADVQVHIQAPADMGGELQLGRDQYRELLVQGWDGVENYRLEVDIQHIEITADGQSARIDSLNRESMDILGNTLVMNIEQRATLQLDQGQALFSHIQAVIRP